MMDVVIQRIRPFTIFLSFLLCGIVPLTATADYELPEEKDRSIVLANKFKLSEQGKNWRIQLRHAEHSLDFPIDLSWLADRINSNSICTGQYEKLMKEYLDKLHSGANNKELLVELVKAGSSGWFVSGIWLSNPKKGFEKAKTYGISLLRLPLNRLKKLKDVTEYRRLIQSESDKGWAKLMGSEKLR